MSTHWEWEFYRKKNHSRSQKNLKGREIHKSCFSKYFYFRFSIYLPGWKHYFLYFLFIKPYQFVHTVCDIIQYFVGHPNMFILVTKISIKYKFSNSEIWLASFDKIRQNCCRVIFSCLLFTSYYLPLSTIFTEKKGGV